MEIEKKHFVFKINADYRPNNEKKPCYYVVARTKGEAVKKFKALISWLDIYAVVKCDEEDSEKILQDYKQNPHKYILF